MRTNVAFDVNELVRRRSVAPRWFIKLAVNDDFSRSSITTPFTCRGGW
jgi:hypothetical protein